MVVTAGIAAFSLYASARLKGREAENVVPTGKVSFVNVADVVLQNVFGIIESALGPDAKKHFPFLGTLFLFVLLSNLFGLIPFAAAPTADLNTTLALGLASFVYYNWTGIKSHGLGGYLAHFTMGLGPIGVLVALFEILSHVLRPGTLALRLFLNLQIDHTVVHTFQGIFAWLLPVPFLLFGIVVCTIQAFVFATLSALYIQLATEHEHGPEHAHESH